MTSALAFHAQYILYLFNKQSINFSVHWEAKPHSLNAGEEEGNEKSIEAIPGN
jgi:hypothetical protein